VRKHVPLRCRLSAPVRPLPDFLIIGAQKCGTSTLCAQLTTHPEIRPAFRKEVHFFDQNYRKGLLWYRAHFDVRLPWSRRWKTLDATPSYLFHPLVPAWVHGALPDAKLIVMLRNPVDRAYSHYQMSVRHGFEKHSFGEALRLEEERLETALPDLLSPPGYDSRVARKQSYKARGRYAEQLERWLKHFPREQLRIYTTRELAAEPERIHADLFSFLGVSPWEVPACPDRNVGSYEPMAPHIREHLEEYFAPHNQRLYRLLGRDLGWEAPAVSASAPGAPAQRAPHPPLAPA
jgi:hypothetical protein